jgi:transcriptional regulator GlxA family with amidase domain
MDPSASAPILPPSAPHAVAILIFDDVEVLDFCGPFEVFSVAAHVALPTEATPASASPLPAQTPWFRVFTVAQRQGIVTAVGGLRVTPDYTLADAPPIDLLIVPGGWGTRREATNASLIAWIGETAAATQLTASVCTGAFLLAGAGLLGGRQATTHWASLDRLAAAYPDVVVQRDTRWVDEGSIVTSAGISAGIDMSLHLVARLGGHALAEATARQMEYAWTPDDASGK